MRKGWVNRQANKERIEKHINELSAYTATPGQGVTRLTYCNEDLQARHYIKEKMVGYGLTVTEDGIGNIYGKLEGVLQGTPSILVGSYFDSVPRSEERRVGKECRYRWARYA